MAQSASQERLESAMALWIKDPAYIKRALHRLLDDCMTNFRTAPILNDPLLVNGFDSHFLVDFLRELSVLSYVASKHNEDPEGQQRIWTACAQAFRFLMLEVLIIVHKMAQLGSSTLVNQLRLGGGIRQQFESGMRARNDTYQNGQDQLFEGGYRQWIGDTIPTKQGEDPWTYCVRSCFEIPASWLDVAEEADIKTKRARRKALRAKMERWFVMEADLTDSHNGKEWWSKKFSQFQGVVYHPKTVLLGLLLPKMAYHVVLLHSLPNVVREHPDLAYSNLRSLSGVDLLQNLVDKKRFPFMDSETFHTLYDGMSRLAQEAQVVAERLPFPRQPRPQIDLWDTLFVALHQQEGVTRFPAHELKSKVVHAKKEPVMRTEEEPAVAEIKQEFDPLELSLEVPESLQEPRVLENGMLPPLSPLHIPDAAASYPAPMIDAESLSRCSAPPNPDQMAMIAKVKNAIAAAMAASHGLQQRQQQLESERAEIQRFGIEPFVSLQPPPQDDDGSNLPSLERISPPDKDKKKKKNLHIQWAEDPVDEEMPPPPPTVDHFTKKRRRPEVTDVSDPLYRPWIKPPPGCILPETFLWSVTFYQSKEWIGSSGIAGTMALGLAQERGGSLQLVGVNEPEHKAKQVVVIPAIDGGSRKPKTLHDFISEREAKNQLVCPTCNTLNTLSQMTGTDELQSLHSARHPGTDPCRFLSQARSDMFRGTRKDPVDIRFLFPAAIGSHFPLLGCCNIKRCPYGTTMESGHDFMQDESPEFSLTIHQQDIKEKQFDEDQAGAEDHTMRTIQDAAEAAHLIPIPLGGEKTSRARLWVAPMDPLSHALVLQRPELFLRTLGWNTRDFQTLAEMPLDVSVVFTMVIRCVTPQNPAERPTSLFQTQRDELVSMYQGFVPVEYKEPASLTATAAEALALLHYSMPIYPVHRNKLLVSYGVDFCLQRPTSSDGEGFGSGGMAAVSSDPVALFLGLEHDELCRLISRHELYRHLRQGKKHEPLLRTLHEHIIQPLGLRVDKEDGSLDCGGLLQRDDWLKTNQMENLGLFVRHDVSEQWVENAILFRMPVVLTETAFLLLKCFEKRQGRPIQHQDKEFREWYAYGERVVDVLQEMVLSRVLADRVRVGRPDPTNRGRKCKSHHEELLEYSHQLFSSAPVAAVILPFSKDVHLDLAISSLSESRLLKDLSGVRHEDVGGSSNSRRWKFPKVTVQPETPLPGKSAWKVDKNKVSSGATSKSLGRGRPRGRPPKRPRSFS